MGGFKGCTMCRLDILEQSSPRTLAWQPFHIFIRVWALTTGVFPKCNWTQTFNCAISAAAERQPHSVHHRTVYQCKNNCCGPACTAPPLILVSTPTPGPQSETKAFICTCMSVIGIHLQSKQFIPPQWQSSSPPVSLPGSQWRLTGQLPAAAIPAS